CGHTHGGQVNLPIVGPFTANRRFGPDLVYGHAMHGDRHIVISAGLGTSIAPVRFMRPPEVVDLTISGPPAATA
ncbi:MAG TPA: metallophosphoesterase, partial [Beijerinckiaceae bacterium]|nr:metallophosphoesterase [Beijerinckiaceae bacterium]